ncbi:MAG: pyridoxine 5'-phosphate synthase [Bacteroidetes bacterium]|nr:pyridoxine 5'-phosphate synthase [Bacteroidota bacterium]
MTKLSVNINKIATLRNARGGNIPDLVQAAIDIQKFGADGITIHPRPDERHIRYSDVYNLKKVVTTEFNIEGYPSMDFMKLVDDVRPEQVTLVPDPPGVLTSNAGWDMITHQSFLRDVVSFFKSIDCRVSLFVDPSAGMVEAAATTGTDRVELYTEAYASGFAEDPSAAILPYLEAAQAAHAVGLGLNAGHDLNLENLAYFHRLIPFLLEVSIGHALISDALYFGLEETVRLYKDCLKE